MHIHVCKSVRHFEISDHYPSGQVPAAGCLGCCRLFLIDIELLGRSTKLFVVDQEVYRFFFLALLTLIGQTETET